MLKETKILINNIKGFRNSQPINEGVSDGDIRKYMEKHQFILIFYAGDGKNPRGWRTIRPMVLGTSKAGNAVVRAWQDKGRSVSKDTPPPPPKRGEKHDFWNDSTLDNKQKPGWRMFRLDKIESMYPTGQRFVKGNGEVIYPPDYRDDGDADMTQISFQVTNRNEPEPERDYEPSDLNVNQKGEKKNWDVFQRGNANRKQIKPEEISDFKRFASRVYKKKANSFFIAINDRDEFELVDVRNKNKVPDQAIVGNLSYLYDKHIKQKPDDESFLDNVRDSALNEVKDKKIGGFPFNIKSFFQS